MRWQSSRHNRSWVDTTKSGDHMPNKLNSSSSLSPSLKDSMVAQSVAESLNYSTCYLLSTVFIVYQDFTVYCSERPFPNSKPLSSYEQFRSTTRLEDITTGLRIRLLSTPARLFDSPTWRMTNMHATTTRTSINILVSMSLLLMGLLISAILISLLASALSSRYTSDYSFCHKPWQRWSPLV